MTRKWMREMGGSGFSRAYGTVSGGARRPPATEVAGYFRRSLRDRGWAGKALRKMSEGEMVLAGAGPVPMTAMR